LYDGLAYPRGRASNDNHFVGLRHNIGLPSKSEETERISPTDVPSDLGSDNASLQATKKSCEGQAEVMAHRSSVMPLRRLLGALGGHDSWLSGHPLILI
ncbi:hypothetical protein, partial [Mesorhizobium sp.]|uniref:hypothetical protein n=1 Tax=Mesorhizobium sp. TaxID=1871066 RepID=UPI002581008E